MTLSTEQAARLVLASAIRDAVGDAVEEIRQELRPELNPGDRTTAWIDGINVGAVSMTQTKFAGWITNGGVDAQWADYVSQLNAAGLGANVDIYQKYYDKAKKG